jgi:quercetin dioxygenase-like cupin family protein
MSSAVPVVLGQDEGDFLWFGAGLLAFKVTSEQSGGVFMLTEDTMGRGKTTPLHVHPRHDETIYVLDGEVIVHLDGVEHTAGPGATAAIPRGTPHALLVTSTSARILAFVTPGDSNAEAFFREGGETAPARTAPPAGTPLNIPRLVAAGIRTGFMDVIGPPPFKRDADAHREDAARA